MVWRPCTQVRLVAHSKLFWKAHAFAKLSTGPIESALPKKKLPLNPNGPSAFLIFISGKFLSPKIFIFTSAGVKDWLVVAKALWRIKPNRCSQLRFGVRVVVFTREIVWFPAFRV